MGLTTHFCRTLLGAVFALAGLLYLPGSSSAQAVYAAREGGRLQAGAGGMVLDTGYHSFRNDGAAFWADYDFSPALGLEGEARLGGLVAPGGVTENAWGAGPRVSLRRRRMTGYVRAAFGRGRIADDNAKQSSVFNVYSLGGGLEYKVSRRLNVRAVDFELQKWPDFKPSALSPTVITIGLSYVIR